MSKVWFITGCSSGFGAGLVDVALSHGDRVVATCRRLDALPMTVAMHEGCLALELDITRPDQISRAVAEGIAAFGQIDVLVNNAGAGWLGSIEDTSAQELADCLAVNFTGPLGLMQALAPHFRERRAGRVINMSAAASISNYPGFGVYGAAKAALDAASESYAAELAASGVSVTTVQPGPFRTQFVGKSLFRTAQQSDAYASTVGQFGNLLQRMDGKQPGDPTKAAEAIVQMVAEDRKPVRLVLGGYATKKATDVARARLKEIEETALWLPKTEF